ncbi:hypothetical protein [Jidongwangia harbinensis]|uniref:hypothetical protein n=1 Tax=Jidongwangia harbinensis TaxID=2878561 RepID=UPI001CD9CDE9|nr:hypothetical protein [Jidongwangia harbinensis]MCA2211437.1 hypothetical protein [Jidongwangia harbinensis]
MRRPVDPYVVRDDTPLTRPGRATGMADVLITAGDGRPRSEQFAALFARYPGLTLAVIVTPGRLVNARARDGATVAVRLEPAVSVRSAALAFHAIWAGQTETGIET